MRCYTLLVLMLVIILHISCNNNDGSDNELNRRPNIVLIMADDMGFSDIEPYGAQHIETPNLNRLAESGIRFTRTYNNAWCSPTRASLLTGLYPQEVGMAGLAWSEKGPSGPYQGYLNDRNVTIAELLKSFGYNTLMSGKWHLGEDSLYWPTKRGFDRYFGLISGASNYFDITKTKIDTTKTKERIVRHMALDNKPYYPPKNDFFMTSAVTEHALEMLEGVKDDDAPFFLYLAYKAPHWPLQALPEDIRRFKGKFNVGWDSLRIARFDEQKKIGILSVKDGLSKRDTEVPSWDPLSGKRKKEEAKKMEVYAAQIYRMDLGIGKVLDKLDSLGKIDNTIIIFLSDNGASAEGGTWGFDSRRNGLPPGGVDSYMSYGKSWANLSNTPFRFYKTFLHEGGVSSPLIINWSSKIPKKMRGSIIKQNSKQAISVLDILPTIIDITKSYYPKTFGDRKILPMEGESFLPLVEGKKNWIRRKPIFWFLNGERAMIKNGWKIVAKKGSAWELYDLEKDRTEIMDLSKNNKDKIRDMSIEWDKWFSRMGMDSTDLKGTRKW